MVRKYDDVLSRFHLIPERYGRTDRQTVRQTDLLYQYKNCGDALNILLCTTRGKEITKKT